MLPKAEKPVANPVVVLREKLDDWAVLFNPDTANAVGINRVGVTIWKLMDGKRNLNDIAKEIRECFDNVPDGALEETEKFVNDLVEKGFVGFELRGET